MIHCNYKLDKYFVNIYYSYYVKYNKNYQAKQLNKRNGTCFFILIEIANYPDVIVPDKRVERTTKDYLDVSLV